MNCILLCALELLLSAGGMELFRQAAREIQKPFPRRVWGAMVFYHVIMSIFLMLYYGTETAVILKFSSVCTVLWVCAWTDYSEYLILNRILIYALFLRIVWALLDFFIYSKESFLFVLESAVVAAAVLGIASLLCKAVSPRAVGGGDIKLLIVFGLYTGMDLAAGSLVYTFLVLFFISVILLVLKKVNRKTVIPFAPFLLAGTTAASVLSGI